MAPNLDYCFHLVPPSSPSVTISPSGPVSVGINATLTCNPGDSVGGATVQGYKWIKGGVALLDGGRVSGSAQATLKITPAILEDQGSYMCSVTNVEGVTVVSGPSQLNITGMFLRQHTQHDSSKTIGYYGDYGDH